MGAIVPHLLTLLASPLVATKKLNMPVSRIINSLIEISESPKVTVGSQIVAHTLIETGNEPNKPNTINL